MEWIFWKLSVDVKRAGELPASRLSCCTGRFRTVLQVANSVVFVLAHDRPTRPRDCQQCFSQSFGVIKVENQPSFVAAAPRLHDSDEIGFAIVQNFDAVCFAWIAHGFSYSRQLRHFFCFAFSSRIVHSP